VLERPDFTTLHQPYSPDIIRVYRNFASWVIIAVMRLSCLKTALVFALVLSLQAMSWAAPPANDLCSGAQLIPTNGPFPYLTTLVSDISQATTNGDPALPSCQTFVSRSIWYKFSPFVSGTYSFSTCASATTVDDTVMAVYASTGACAGPFTEISCNDDLNSDCSNNPLLSGITAQLNAGTQYYIIVWRFGTDAPAAGQTAIQLLVSGPPANDNCSTAEVIPTAGPFPYLTTTQDIAFATMVNDPPPPSCQPNISRSIWYRFTPPSTTLYEISTCAGTTATTVPNTVMAIYTTTSGCAGAFAEIPSDGLSDGCDAGSCPNSQQAQAVITTQLASGTTYYIVVWQYGSNPPDSGSSTIQLSVNRGVQPLNSVCDTATEVMLDTPINGTTVTGTNSYQLSGSACYMGLSNVVSTASGRDVVYSFTAPETTNYSFRVSNYTNDLVLYITDACPALTSAPPVLVTNCLAAVNRTTSIGAEEVVCLPLASDQTVYVFVDGATGTASSSFTLEVNECVSETETNNSPATANALACGIEGSINPAGDVDFFSLGMPPAGSRVFAFLDAAAANNANFDLRVTTATDTLEYGLSNNVAGTPLTGSLAFLRVSLKSAAIATEPYRLYAVVQPPISSATPEIEPNGTIAQANMATNNYFRGTLSGPAPSTDVDMYAFRAAAGTLLFLSLDENPQRTNAPVRAALALLDSNGIVLASVNNPASTSSTNSGVGSLTATNPYSPAQGLVYRTRTTGKYYARVSIGTNTTSAVGAGDYLLLISKACRPGGNTPPDADNHNTSVPGDVSSLLTLTGSDFEADPLTFQVTSQPVYGILSSLNSTTGDIMYTPAHGYSGPDTFTFIANDGVDNSAPAAFNITVLPLLSSVGDGIPDSWRARYFGGSGMSTNSQSCALCDPDSDGMNNLQEYMANTIPNNATSRLRIISVIRNPNGQSVLTWSSVGGTRYRVQYNNGDAKGGYNNVFTDVVRSSQVEMDPNPVGIGATLSFTDDFTLTGGTPPQGVRYYRIKVVQ
jgi:hypothetical protein